jgi:hypothetical protein
MVNAWNSSERETRTKRDAHLEQEWHVVVPSALQLSKEELNDFGAIIHGPLRPLHSENILPPNGDRLSRSGSPESPFRLPNPQLFLCERFRYSTKTFHSLLPGSF